MIKIVSGCINLELKNNDLKERAIFLSAVFSIILVFSFVVFGVTGARIALGIIFVSIPFYFILNNFQLQLNEKVVFSLLLGFTVFPSLVYILAFVISFRISIIVIFILLVIVSLLIKRFVR